MQKKLRIFCVIFLVYMFQTTFLPRMMPLGTRPDLMLAMLVVLTLGGDRYLGFTVGAVIGIVLDAMVGQVAVFYLVIYPLVGYLAARLSPFLLALRPWPARLRLLLAPVVCLVLSTVTELVLLMYRYLNGADISASVLGRSMRIILLTTLSSVALQGFLWICLREAKKGKHKKKKSANRVENLSQVR